MTLHAGATVRLPNGVVTVVHPGHLPGERWRLVHSWAQWAITDAGEILTLGVDRRRQPTRRATGWTQSDLREG